MAIIIFNHTVCFTDLGKLSLLLFYSILSSSQLSLLSQQPLKMTHALKVVKIDFKKSHLAILILIGETDCNILSSDHPWGFEKTFK
jgi:hypothetical protein